MGTRLTFSWWNTALSPLGQRRSNQSELQVAAETIRYLLVDLEVDCLALGEVTPEDVREIMKISELPNYTFFDGTQRSGRVRFDTGLLYHTGRLGLVDTESIRSIRGTRSLKVSHRHDLVVLDGDYLIHVFVCHWPSRLWCEENSADRHVLGLRLREAIASLKANGGVPSQSVVLGDFNDEPHDKSLAEQLLASRDRRLVRKRSDYLYNPFWRTMGEHLPHVPERPNNSYAGTCYYGKGVDTKWRTFDQIIFSGSFLGDGTWQLNEEYTRVVYLEGYDKRVTKPTEVFDHFPVISAIQRVEKNG